MCCTDYTIVYRNGLFCTKLLTLVSDILRVMPSKAIELAAFDAYKKLLSHEDANGKVMRPGPLFTGLAGAAAGIHCHSVTPCMRCHFVKWQVHQQCIQHACTVYTACVCNMYTACVCDMYTACVYSVYNMRIQTLSKCSP